MGDSSLSDCGIERAVENSVLSNTFVYFYLTFSRQNVLKEIGLNDDRWLK